MKIYYDLALQSRVVTPGQTNLTKPILFYGTAPAWEICLTDNGEVPDLSGITAWRAAVDGDFDKDTLDFIKSSPKNPLLRLSVLLAKSATQEAEKLLSDHRFSFF